MITIDVIKASILCCEAEVDICTWCEREGLCIGTMLYVGFECRFKGIDSYVNKVRGCYCIIGTLLCVGFKCLFTGLESYVNKVRGYC